MTTSQSPSPSPTASPYPSTTPSRPHSAGRGAAGKKVHIDEHVRRILPSLSPAGLSNWPTRNPGDGENDSQGHVVAVMMYNAGPWSGVTINTSCRIPVSIMEHQPTNFTAGNSSITAATDIDISGTAATRTKRSPPQDSLFLREHFAAGGQSLSR
ncbi:hypothetical protein E2C01_007467 [Portunus trituberculatus]|uniref:Uncharacterized protein n=1 Tax=Portunus trituberculatus TaxID=210409 RepID=A0A5B7D2H8_PORTR|nr:hypothetical protein [Portunus trituberculatus]